MGRGQRASSARQVRAAAWASPEQVAALYKAFEDNYRPNFEVGDLRKFARACWDSEIIIGLYVVKGPTVPLQHRPPFQP